MRDRPFFLANLCKVLKTNALYLKSYKQKSYDYL